MIPSLKEFVGKEYKTKKNLTIIKGKRKIKSNCIFGPQLKLAMSALPLPASQGEGSFHGPLSSASSPWNITNEVFIVISWYEDSARLLPCQPSYFSIHVRQSQLHRELTYTCGFCKSPSHAAHWIPGNVLSCFLQHQPPLPISQPPGRGCLATVSVFHQWTGGCILSRREIGGIAV